MATPTVVGLLRICRPATIPWLIVAVIILSVNRMLRRGARPHIGVEVLKAMSPALANSDSSATVVRKVLLFRSSAARNHLLPNGILWRLALAMLAHKESNAFFALTRESVWKSGVAIEVRTSSRELALALTTALGGRIRLSHDVHSLIVNRLVRAGGLFPQPFGSLAL